MKRRNPLGFRLVSGMLATAMAMTLVEARVFTAGHSRWTRGSRADGDRRISMHISVAASESAVASAAEHLYRVSNPESSEYGSHWTADRVESHFAPTTATILELVNWLNESGASRSTIRVSRDRSHIFAALQVRDAERLLKTEYYDFHDSIAPGSEPQLAAGEYTIPDALAENIHFIEPTFPTDLGRVGTRRTKVQDSHGVNTMRRSTANNGTKVDCLRYITPECLRLLYHIPNDELASSPGSTFGLYQNSWMTWLPSDLDQFFTRFEPQLVGSRPAMLPVNGGYTQTNFTGFAFNAEPALDFEYAMSLTHPQPVINIQVGDYFTTGSLNNMLAALDASYCHALDPEFDNLYPVSPTVSHPLFSVVTIC